MTKQLKTPIFDAVKKYFHEGTVPFVVPGHKKGNGLPEFKEYVGANVLGIDVTCFSDTDNICNPKGVIAEAENLAAEAYGADQAYFLVNGTTAGIQAMIMAVCKPEDKIILPRNAHKSAFGGLIMSGAKPVYLEPEMNREFGISMGVTPEKVEWAILQHPDAKAVFLVNPNYYGTASDLVKITKISHAHGIPVVVDEAHGAHFKFNAGLPISAMEAGADLAASSTHKLIGSLTQSSMLLLKEGLVNPKRVKAALNLTQTTSPSYLLLSSLDVARKQIATKGEELIGRTVELAQWVRDELKSVPGIKVFGEGLVGQPGCAGFDPTKVTINVRDLGLSGYEMEKILRSQYRIQVELSDLYNTMFLITLGDTWESVAYLVNCVKEIAWERTYNNVIKICPPVPAIPPLSISPREAFYSSTRILNLQEAAGEICAEAIMAYPPGIPLICPGEVITQEIIDYVNILKQEQADLQGTEDPNINYIKVVDLAATKELIDKEIYTQSI